MDQQTFDQTYLAQCLDLARRAGSKNEVPVGAMVVNNQTGEVVASAYNLRESLNTPIGHAEILAIHKACKKLGTWRLTGHTLYSSLEPCVMCSGAIIQSRIDRVVYSATDTKGGGQSLFQLFDSLKLNHRVNWQKGSFEADNRTLLQDFFKERRKKPDQ
ncbi:MAG: nucleoside deaminase [Bdellovibrionales bacterium]|nr:nucleoside deaminase [Bdellovibrionales bacterium]